MNRLFKITLLSSLVLSASACAVPETGEVGVRKGFDNQIQTEELLPGSFNQTIIGSVLHFPIKDVQVSIDDLTPLASDNSTIKDFDMAVVYSVNPSSAAEIYIEKNRGFHAVNEEGDTLLLYYYMGQLARNAAYKVARQYESLKMADNRGEIEQKIREEVIRQLRAEKLDGSVNVSQVLVRAITPADSIVASANALVRAQNENKQKQVEVQTAKLEAERQNALAENSEQTIKYMNAEATKMFAQAALQGKVNTIIVSPGVDSIVNVK